MGETGMSLIRLEPVYKKSIWAGERLTKIRGLTASGIGISREVCAYPGSENVIAAGPMKGEAVGRLIADYHRELMGEDDSNQLVRVAFMDTAEDLSIQVHPDEAQASIVGDYEKSESWYILEAGEGAYITAGVNCGDSKVLRKAAEESHLEEYLIRHPVKKGDFAMIPAKMIHACGGNMLVLEIGSFGGITYRLYDYGRGRPLDLDRSLEIMDPNLACLMVHCQEKQDNELWTVGTHRLFQVDVLDVREHYYLKGNGKYRILTCVEGFCRLQCEGEVFILGYTETILVPAAREQVEIAGTCRLIIAER